MIKSKNKYAIVCIAYNRPDGLKRLLKSLKKADYCSDSVSLIISIDKSGEDDVEKVAKDFEWNHGDKRILTYKTRMGLRAHILKCGDLLDEFDAIVVLEDDLVASPAFYSYVKQSVEYYSDCDNIAGISLYTHAWNVGVNQKFEPYQGCADVFFMQYAQSWGQVWMKKQWRKFKDWYKENGESMKSTKYDIPFNVTNWSSSSWLKYHIKYCIENNFYFVYPYKGLTTCYCDVGEHIKVKENHLQIQMMIDSNKQYEFCNMENSSAVVYDSFFEREGLGQYLGKDNQEVTVDLYGYKKQYKRYLLTTNILEYKVLETYSLLYRPHELNIVLDNKEWDDIFLYDTKEIVETKYKKHKNSTTLKRYIYYNNLWGNSKSALIYIVSSIVNKIRYKLK